MKRIILLITFVLLITGCSNNEDRIVSVHQGFDTSVHYDKETCVEYFSNYNRGTVIMINEDGTPKLNNECLNERKK